MRGRTVKRGKTWSYVVDVGADPVTGKRRQKWTGGFAREKEARSALNAVLVQLDRGTYIAEATDPLATFLLEWLETRTGDLRPSTLHSYRRNIECHVIPRIGETALGKIDPGILNRLYAELGNNGARRNGDLGGLSARTIQYIATIISAALSDAVRWGRLAVNPAIAARPPRPRASGSRQIEAWSATTLKAFLTASSAYGDRYYPLWVMLASTGARRGEALGLRWSDLDLDAARVRIVQTVIAIAHRVEFGDPKTEAGLRSIALDSSTVNVVRAWKVRQAEERLALGAGYCDHGLIFAKATGEPLHPERVSREFSRRVDRWSLQRIPLHGLRHTWATLALGAGIHPRVVQERLGHASIAVTLGVYSHVTTNHDADAAAIIAAQFQIM